MKQTNKSTLKLTKHSIRCQFVRYQLLYQQWCTMNQRKLFLFYQLQTSKLPTKKCRSFSFMLLHQRLKSLLKLRTTQIIVFKEFSISASLPSFYLDRVALLSCLPPHLLPPRFYLDRVALLSCLPPHLLELFSHILRVPQPHQRWQPTNMSTSTTCRGH